MAQINQLGRVPGIELPVKNYGVSDIAAGLAVIIDTTNTPAGSGTPMGVTLPASDAAAFGILVTTAVAGRMANVQLSGVAIGVASATIHVGDVLMTDSAGKLLPQTAGKFQIGVAMSEAVSTDNVAVLISRAKNA
jgi:hypothetical protein